MRRFFCVLTLLAMLATLPQAALAVSAQEALFGDSQPAEQPAAPAAETAAAETDDDIYGADSASISQYPTLQLGDRDGEDSAAYIVFLQNRLIELGYLSDAADGVFGSNTQTAVREFQKYNGLEETGVATPATQTKLFSDASTLERAPMGSVAMDNDTTRVQAVLARWGFYGGTVDGKQGSGTASAIATFKKYIRTYDPTFGVTPTPEPTATPNPDGYFDDMPVVMDQPLITEEAQYAYDSRIDSYLLEYVDGAKSFEIYRQTVRVGDSGSEALRVQTRLHQLNYLWKADGAFGEVSGGALLYFQRKHGLPQNAIADEATQKILFSDAAMPAEEYVFPYKVVVDISDQRVYVGKWTGEAYTDLVHTFVCSTGKDGTPTPTGTYQAEGKGGDEWYYFKDFNCYARWGYRIVGGILFHSVTYNSQKQLVRSSVSNLGHKASHGCVRLSVDDAKWIYDNCPMGTTVVIQQ